jgi:hypothetical protein
VFKLDTEQHTDMMKLPPKFFQMQLPPSVSYVPSAKVKFGVVVRHDLQNVSTTKCLYLRFVDLGSAPRTLVPSS